MYTTIIHPLRKALLLSCNEYCVLDSIYNLSNNSKYGGWCIASNSRLAGDLDLSVRTIISSKNKLSTMNLIELSTEKGNMKGASRPTEFLRELMQNKSDWTIAIDTDIVKMISGKVKGSAESAQGVQEVTQGVQKLHRGVQKLHKGSAESAHYKQSNNNSNNKRTKKKVVGLPFHTEEFKNAWSEWKEYKRIEKGFKFKSTISESKSLTELKNMSGDNEHEAIRLINNAIAKGWSGIYTDSKKTPTTTSPNQPLFIYKINGERKKHSDQKRWQRDKDCFEQVDCYEEIEIRK